MTKMLPIVGFENYLITSDGKVFSKKTNKYLKLKYPKNKNKYIQVVLHKNGNHFYKDIHRLVALHFLSKKELDDEVNHIDGNKLNNNVSNLEFISHKQNMKHASLNKLFKSNYKKIIQYSMEETKIKEFNSLLDASTIIMQDNISKTNNVSYIMENIWKNLNGIRKSAYGFIWKYKEVGNE